MDLFDLRTLGGGLAFFLYGMNVMSHGLEKLAGGKLEGILSNTVIFGSDLMALGLGGRINSMFKELLAGPGAVRATLKKYLD